MAKTACSACPSDDGDVILVVPLPRLLAQRLQAAAETEGDELADLVADALDEFLGDLEPEDYEPAQAAVASC